MKNTISILITMLILTTVTAQERTKHRLQVETLGGYEYNYFRSPKVVEQDGVTITEQDLIASSSYQDIMAKYDYSLHWKENRLRFSLDPSARIFYEAMEDSYWSLNAILKYDREINRNLDFLAEAGIRRMDREGLGGAQDILINPLGYTTYSVAAGLEFEAIKNNETAIMAYYDFKNFDAFGIRDLQFNRIGLEVKTKQEFKVNNLDHAYGAKVNINKRLYDTFNASDVDTNGERDWSYFVVDVFYELPVSKTFKLKPNFMYYSRTDNLDKRSGFQQFGPELSLKFDNGITRVWSSLGYITRSYTTLEARDNNGATGEKIQYRYANITLNVEHKLGVPGLYLTGEAFSRVRSTNYTAVNARSFRNYTNQYAGIGMKWKL